MKGFLFVYLKKYNGEGPMHDIVILVIACLIGIVSFGIMARKFGSECIP